MDIKGKKLLVLTGCNGARDIIRYAKSKGVFVFATDYYQNSKVKQEAISHFNVSTTDIEGLLELINLYDIDGVTTGTSESSMYSILNISERQGLPFYATRQQLETINDKKKFKHLLLRHNVPVPPEFSINDKIEYPVIVKPVDSSGSKGISVCESEAELSKSIEFALSHSRSADYVIEKCIKGYPEVFFNFTFIDGSYSLSCAFDNYKNRNINGFAGDAVFNIYPSKHIGLFKATVEPQVLNLFRDIGIKNGVISIQTFFNGESFMVYEAGFRLGGTQSYIFTDYLNNINHMQMMVNHSLTGKMYKSDDILKKDNPFFKRVCCQRNISIRAGEIKKIIGLSKIKSLKEVINITQVSFEGDIVKSEDFRRKLFIRVHIVGDSLHQISRVNDKINSMVKVLDQNNEDMIIERSTLEQYNIQNY